MASSMDTEVNIELEDRYCVFPDSDKHLALEPIRLSCYHFVCKSCLIGKRITRIRCANDKCKKFNKFKENEAKVDDTVIFSNEIFQLMFQDAINKIEKVIHNKVEEICYAKEYVKKELTKRTKSLEINLDEIRNEIFNMLTSYKNMIVRDIKTYRGVKYHLCLERFNEEIQRGEDIKLDEYSKTFARIQKHLYHIAKDIQVEVNKKNVINTKIIADLCLGENEKITQHMIDKHKFVTLNENFDGMFFLHFPGFSEGVIVLSSKEKKRILFCNQEFEIQTGFKAISGKRLQPTFILTNHKDRIYIADEKNIIITDMEFNLVNGVKLPEKLNMKVAYMQFNGEYLLAYDSNNHKIHALTLELKDKGTVEIKDNPTSIVIANGLVVTSNEHKIDFKEVVQKLDLKLKFSYSIGESSKLFYANGYFYAFTKKTKQLYCFDKNGVYIRKLQYQIPHYLTSLMEDAYEPAFYFNDETKNLYFTLGLGKILVHPWLKM